MSARTYYRHPDGFICSGESCANSDSTRVFVIDPESHEEVARLADAFCIARWSHIDGSNECDPLTRSSMQAALRDCIGLSLDEPIGLGAVVANVKGHKFVRVADAIDGWMKDRQWQRIGGEVNAVRNFGWSEIAAVEVLSEGVTA